MPRAERLHVSDVVLPESLLATPGHTRGHQSVVVEGGGGVVVIAAQSVWDIEEFHNEEATPPNVGADDLRSRCVESAG